MDDVGFQLAEIAADARTGSGRCGQILDLFATIDDDAPGAMITRWDAVARRITAVAVRGDYSSDLVRHVLSGAWNAEPAYEIIRRDLRRPIRSWHDLAEVQYARSPTAQEFLVPMGFRGGVTMRLATRAGEYVGDLHLSTESRNHPSTRVMRLLDRSRTAIAAVVRDTLSPRVPPSATLPAADNAVLLRPDGSVHALDDGVARPPLDSGSPLLQAIKGRADRTWHWRDERGTWFRIDVRPVRGGVVVAAEPVRSARGLSLRELEVLELLGLGLTNLRIARTLYLSERTVAHHVERILDKLGVTTRTAAVAVMERDGLRLLR
jgi:DNA-binding CsgD family transcriptional regulator